MSNEKADDLVAIENKSISVTSNGMPRKQSRTFGHHIDPNYLF